jgi:glycosyltransferase involved in cell wall biosynthesis
MKVAIVTDIYYPHVNGVSSFVQRMATLLVKRGHDVLLIAPSTSMTNEYFVRDGIKIFGVRSIPIFLYPRYRWSVMAPERQMERILRKQLPDVLHLQTHFALARAALRAGRKLNIPVVGTNHFMPENVTPYLHLPASLEAIVQNWVWRYFLRTYEKLDVATVPSHSALVRIWKAGFSGEGKVISNGVDLKQFSPECRDDLIARHLFPEGPKMLYVGRLDWEKNVAFAIRAFAKIAEYIDGYFIIAGSGSEENKLRSLARKLGIGGRIIFTGFVPACNLPALYRAADVFIMPGTAELQSIATMEAMATGLPIIAADAMALPELVHDGVNGLLFQPSDQTSLVRCIEATLSSASLRERLGQASLREIQKHEINYSASSFEKLYATFSSATVRQVAPNACNNIPLWSTGQCLP